jgi:hypothetical protein
MVIPARPASVLATMPARGNRPKLHSASRRNFEKYRLIFLEISAADQFSGEGSNAGGDVAVAVKNQTKAAVKS